MAKAVAPTLEVEASVVPTVEAEASVAPTLEVEASVVPTVEAEASVAPTLEAEASVAPTLEVEASVDRMVLGAAGALAAFMDHVEVCPVAVGGVERSVVCLMALEEEAAGAAKACAASTAV